MKMKKEDREIFLKQIFWEVVGSAFIAGGIYNFAVQAGFPMTGFSGISIILYQLFGVPIGFSTILLNIPVAILCYRLLGRHFFFSSLRCMLISSLMIDYVAPLFPVLLETQGLIPERERIQYSTGKGRCLWIGGDGSGAGHCGRKRKKDGGCPEKWRRLFLICID